jgi:hypothetical protein
MKKISLALMALTISMISFSQSTDSGNEEVIIKSEKRVQATKGTYQLIFKNQESKDWFFSTGVLMASKYVGVGGITSYSDLLIVIHENRQKEKKQEFEIGENEEVTLIVLPLDFIKSSQYQPLEEFTFKK